MDARVLTGIVMLHFRTRLVILQYEIIQNFHDEFNIFFSVMKLMTMTISIDVKMVLQKSLVNVSGDVVVYLHVSSLAQMITKLVLKTVRVWKAVQMVAHVTTGIALSPKQLRLQHPLLPRLQQLPQQRQRLPLRQRRLPLLQHHLILFLFFTQIQLRPRKLT